MAQPGTMEPKKPFYPRSKEMTRDHVPLRNHLKCKNDSCLGPAKDCKTTQIPTYYTSFTPSMSATVFLRKAVKTFSLIHLEEENCQCILCNYLATDDPLNP